MDKRESLKFRASLYKSGMGRFAIIALLIVNTCIQDSDSLNISYCIKGQMMTHEEENAWHEFLSCSHPTGLSTEQYSCCGCVNVCVTYGTFPYCDDIPTDKHFIQIGLETTLLVSFDACGTFV